MRSDYEYFKSLLRLDPETGYLFWIKRGRGRTLGRRAGHVCKTDGYRKLKVNYNTYICSRVVWLLTTGEWPKQFIDHINRDRSDDRPCNLRDVSCKVNCNNQSPESNNATGVKGVYFARGSGYYAMRFGKYIGSYKTKEEAKAAYLSKAYNGS